MSVAGKPHLQTYPMNVVTFARRLHEQNGMTAHQIRKSLMQRGYRPAHNTILRWIDEDYAAMWNERRRAEKRRKRGGLKGKHRETVWGLRLSRMEELRNEVGLTYASIAKLMAHDFGLSIGKDQTERILKGMVSGRTIRRVLSPKDQQEAQPGRPEGSGQ